MQKKSKFDSKAVGNRIRKARQILHKAQYEVSEIADISAQYWSAVETGRERGSVNTYLQIANALGVTLNDLFYSKAEQIRAKKIDLNGLLKDCNEYEKAVLNEILLNVKSTLIRSRKLL